jgi:hypothetical protein
MARRWWRGCQAYAPAAFYPQGHNAVGKIRPIEKSSDLIRSRTHDIQACGTVPQPTMLLSVPVQANNCEILTMFPISSLCNHPRTETSGLSNVIWAAGELHTLMFMKGGF